MTTQYLTRPQAIAAAKYFIADWHENAPIMDGITYVFEVRQLARELSAKLRADIDPYKVEGCLSVLDELDKLHYGIDAYADLPGDLQATHERILTESLEDEYHYVIDASGSHFEQVAA